MKSTILLLIFMSMWGCFTTQAQIGSSIATTRRVDWANVGYGSIPTTYAVTVDITTVGGVGDGVTNNGPAIQGAINAANPSVLTMIYFPTGSYVVNQTIFINKNNIVLKGAGPDYTKLHFKNLAGNCIQISGATIGGEISVLGGNTKGSTSLTLGSGNSTINIGDYIELKRTMDGGTVCNIPDAVANCASTVNDNQYSFGQVVKVVSKTGNVIGLEDGLSMAYDLQTFRVQRLNVVQNVGVQDLSLIEPPYIAGDVSAYKIYCAFVAKAWVSGIISYNTNGDHIGIVSSTKVEVRGSKLEYSNFYGGKDGYGIYIGERSTNCLVENNILTHHRHSIVLSLSPNRNVIGYNYSGEEEYPSGQSEFVVHGFYPHANLFEGNIAGWVDIDSEWGLNGPYNTMFRNQFGAWDIRAASYTNIAGNNFYSNQYSGGNPPNLLNLNNGTSGTFADVSYYKTAKPSFLSAKYTWPLFGPALPGGPQLSNTNPAEVRYENGGQFTINQRDPIAGYSIDNDGLLSGFATVTYNPNTSQYITSSKIYRNDHELSLGSDLYYSNVNWKVGPMTTVILSNGNEEILTSYNSANGINSTAYATVYISTNKNPNSQTLVFNKSDCVITSLTSGDFNGDGIDEVVIGYLENSMPRLYKSSNPYSLEQTLLYSNPSIYWTVSALTAGDFDGNGSDELIIGLNSTGAQTQIYKSVGAVGLGTQIYSSSAGYWKIDALAAMDFDKNGSDELIEGFNSSGGAAIYKSVQANSTAYNIYPINSNWKVAAMAVGDFDKDGDKELVTGFNSFNSPTKGVSIYKSETPDLITDVRIYNKPDLGADLISLAIEKKDIIVIGGGRSAEVPIEESETMASLVTIYPNPTNGMVTIRVENTDENLVTVEVYNLLGEKVTQTAGTSSEIELDLSNQTKGVYILNVLCNGEKSQHKVIVE